MSSYRAYFAYGSNLSTVRLRRRVPSALPRRIGFVRGYDVALSKRGKDGSAKATLAVRAESRAHGCVYIIEAQEKVRLDRIEGVGVGYDEHVVRVVVEDHEIEAFTYIASSTHIDAALRPYDWYVALMYAGASEHHLPGAVTERYRAVETIRDPDRTRATRHWAMLGAAGSPDT
jgi:gamma-glutamylcyclotransferase (GGCT)/AIG2-like uncharacterized protein YtfP